MAGEIIHWNISGLKCKRSPNYKEKINYLRSFLEKNNSTYILNIQETHISKSNELPSILKLHEHLYNFVIAYSRNDDPYSGILLGIRKTEDIISTEILENGRLVFVKIQNKSNKKIMNIFSIYCNPSDPDKQKDLILRMKRKIMLDNLEDYIILGDFNFVTSILDRNNNCLNRNDLETLKIWTPFENEFKLQDCFRLTNPSRRLYSYNSKCNKKIKSRIDRVYVFSNLLGKIISSVFVSNSVSDHKIVKVKMAMNVDKGPGMWILNNTLLDDVTYTRRLK